METDKLSVLIFKDRHYDAEIWLYFNHQEALERAEEIMGEWSAGGYEVTMGIKTEDELHALLGEEGDYIQVIRESVVDGPVIIKQEK